MANRSKEKGDREERAVVHTFRDEGYTVERTLESGARSDGSDPWDINLETSQGVLRGECKILKNGFKTIYNWFDKTNIDFLTIRADKKERLYVVPERVFLNFLESMKK